MVKAVQVHTVGGRHRLKVEEVELARPGCLEVEVRHTAIGLNYLDVQDCKGGHHHSTHHPTHVFTPGRSAVGIITELGTNPFFLLISICMLKFPQSFPVQAFAISQQIYVRV